MASTKYKGGKRAVQREEEVGRQLGAESEKEMGTVGTCHANLGGGQENKAITQQKHHRQS